MATAMVLARARRRRRAAGQSPLSVALALVVFSQYVASRVSSAEDSTVPNPKEPIVSVPFAELLRQGWQEGHNSHALHHHSDHDGWRVSLHGHHEHHEEAVLGSNTSVTAIELEVKKLIENTPSHQSTTIQGPPTHETPAAAVELAPAVEASPPAPASPPPLYTGSVVAPIMHVAALGAAAGAGTSGLLVPRAQKTVLLVGNGRSVLKHDLGPRIDAYDIVGRFNYFELKGYSKNVGTKTNLWFLNEMKIPGPGRIRTKISSFTSSRQMNLKIQPTMKYVVSVTYGYSKGCGPKAPQKCRISGGEQKRVGKINKELRAGYAKFKITDKLDIMKPDYQHLLATKYGYSTPHPSTGLLAIVYCLENFGAPVTITGFDFQEKSLGHYFEKVKKTWTSHSMKGELKFIARMKAAGMLTVI